MSIKAGQRITSSTLNSLAGLSGPADKSSHVVTGTSAAALTASWTIPANDAVAGTVYRLTFAGFGTWGSTAQIINVVTFIDGVNVMAGGGAGQVLAAEFAASTPLAIRGVAELLIVSAGSSGTYTVTLDYTLNHFGTVLTGTAASNSVSVVNMNSTTGATAAIDTTISHTMAIAAAWGSTTGAPTITGTQSYLERLQSA